MSDQMKDVKDVIFKKQQSKLSEGFRKQSKSKEPMTRYEKIRSKKIISPYSTQNKIVFVSNSQANGFKMQKFKELAFNFEDINIEGMVREINKASYDQWVINKEKLKENSFKNVEILIKLLYSIVFVIILCLFVFTYNKLAEPIIISVYIISGILIMGLFIACYIYLSERQDFDGDAQMKRAIKRKLAELNIKEEQQENGKPRFMWTCQVDCIWIAIGLVDYMRKDDC